MKDLPYIQERILQFFDTLDYSDRQITMKLGFSNGYVGSLRRGVLMGIDKLEQIFKVYPELNKLWVLTGNGDMLQKDRDQAEIVSVKSYNVLREPTPSYITVDNIGNENILFVSTKASAGYLSGINDPEFLRDLPAYGLPGFQHGTYRAFEVQGDSMYQYQTKAGIHPGSWVIAQAIEKLDYVRDNRVYVVVSLDEGVIVKRCLNRLSRPDNPLLICQSDNKSGEYPNILLRPDQIREIWEFKAMITRHVPPPSDMYQTVTQLEADVIEIKEQLKNLHL